MKNCLYLLFFFAGGRSREGRPIITFPDRCNFATLSEDNYRKLIVYLTSVPPWVHLPLKHYILLLIIFLPPTISNSYFVQAARRRFGLRSHCGSTRRSLERRQDHPFAALGKNHASLFCDLCLSLAVKSITF